MKEPTTLTSNRILSLDVFRGLTMFLLLAEAALVYASLSNYFSTDSVGGGLIQQFHHHPWNGLRFWDLIQPFFMFIVGVAMPFSLRSRLKRGDNWNDAFRHILRRCLLLFLFGVGLHCVYSGFIVWELWNVLTQLSFTILLTFLIMGWPWKRQLAVSLVCLLLTELIYRLYDPSAPFVKDLNFGSWLDQLLMGKIDDGGGWVAINCLPTAAHTIWGAMVGQLLLSAKTPALKVKNIVYAGVAALIIGYSLDFFQITPIIKRIATSSFTLASGGWALLALAFFYWLIDLKGHKKGVWFFAVVGSNSIFIYLFAETIGHQWLTGFAKVWGMSICTSAGLSLEIGAIVSAFLTLGIMWYLCYFLWQRKIFFKV